MPNTGVFQMAHAGGNLFQVAAQGLELLLGGVDITRLKRLPSLMIEPVI